MKWLLDTNVLSETIRARPAPSVSSWIVSQRWADLSISIVTLAEIREGIETSADEEKRRDLANWLEADIIIPFSDRTLPVDLAVLLDWIRISKALAQRQITRPATDLLLAATARIHDLIVVTRNTRDFANTGITVYNPWTDETHKMEAP